MNCLAVMFCPAYVAENDYNESKLLAWPQFTVILFSSLADTFVVPMQILRLHIGLLPD